ncbi:MAG: hypothetical protein ACE5LS_02410 [Thermoplasmata archaeon]
MELVVDFPIQGIDGDGRALVEAGLAVWHEFLPNDPKAMRRRIEQGPPPWE